MKTEVLAPLLLVAVLFSWVVSLGTPGETIGMYADSRDVLYHGDSDVYDCIWHFSWIRQCMEQGRDPRVYGDVTLAWHNMGWTDLFLSYLFRYGYEVSLMLSSLFAAVAGYILARSWGLGRNGALLAGFITAWMPVRTIRMYQHYQLASIGFTLLSLAMVRAWYSRGFFRYLPGAFIFSGLAVMESFHHGVTIALGWLVTVLISRWKSMRTFSLSAMAPGLGCMAGALWLLTSPGISDSNPGKDWRESVFWGAELQSYFLPSFLGQPLIMDYMPNPWEGVVTPGLVVILLGMIYCVQRKNWRAAAAAFAVMILSVGPLFKFNGIPTPIPLPYMIMAKTPWLSAARAPSRLGIIVGLMAALGTGAFIEKRKPVFGWILTGLVLLELTPVTLKTIDTAVPSFYRSVSSPEVRLEIPASPAIRRYASFEAADGLPRRVKFFSRGGDEMLTGIPAGLLWDPQEIPFRDDLMKTGAETVIYNRWMFPEEERAFYDSVYSGIFDEGEKSDSLWVWMAE